MMKMYLQTNLVYVFGKKETVSIEQVHFCLVILIEKKKMYYFCI